MLMAMVNARYEFIMVDAGMNGRVFDGGVMNHSTFGIMFQANKLNFPVPEPLHDGDTINVSNYFVADDAFAMTENLLKLHGVGPDPFNQEKQIFNYPLSRAQRVVENAF